ncbi:MAG: site-specific DNA-methyltransferase [Candidatus Parvarchaeota archaeon]|nr:site-specific DNA-methyltransferase [Candidatus Parvarchaeum tengchongense]MCW1298821.1 site-specific DNA-methyltransferase [Candidatus Parvarchaeum tengchongense]MCW1312513.1 site-specific DNA-methyltransferase [Candidatus Parvarchaeum tengchongense]
MPTLNWIGKEAVVNHDKEVPFRLLKKVKSASVGENSQNLIIHGDNLEALKALMPYYTGKIKCIYIDPPYNTGNENWVYNDNVNSPKIKKWIGKVVGSESEDLSRHDKWLCMMYPRLKLLRDLLSDDGIIFVSIDDNEYCNLNGIMNEIFGEENFVGALPRTTRRGGKTDSLIVSEMDIILSYSKNKDMLNKSFGIIKTVGDNYKYKDEFFEERGLYQTKPLDVSSLTYSKNMDYIFTDKEGNKYYAGGKERYNKRKKNKQMSKDWTWRWSKDKLDFALKTGFAFLKDGKIQTKIYEKKIISNQKPYKIIDKELNQKIGSLYFVNNIYSNFASKKDIDMLFDNKVFEYSKPVELIKQLLKISTSQDDIILDSFAGSGTTGHAVLDLNKEDGGNRKFILLELEDKVAKDITAERVKRAIKKYGYNGGFEYCELDKPLFDENGQINKECTFEQLATYVYFTETNTNIDKNKIYEEFIGEHNENEYYLLFDGMRKNVLDRDFLKKLEKNGKRKVIYADKCLVDDRTLEKNKIQFKQIPYEVKVY